MSATQHKRLGVWGASRVGKTTLLATALFGNDPVLRPLVQGEPGGAVNRELFDVYRRLVNNQYTPPTSQDLVSIPLGRMDGSIAVELVDVRGLLTLQINRAEVQQMARALDGVLFLVEYSGAHAQEQMAAVAAAVIQLGERPMALAFTKCECWLPYDSDIWDRPAKWIERTPLWASHRGTLERFAALAWPTSAFGYDPHTGLPAMILGEMGQLFPYNIQPRHVAEPLVALLRRLECV